MRIRGGVLVYKRCVLIFIAIHAFFNICKIGAGGGGGIALPSPHCDVFAAKCVSRVNIYR